MTNLPIRLGSILLFRSMYLLLASVLKFKWHLLSAKTCFLKLLFRVLVTKEVWPVKMSCGEAAKFLCFLPGAPDSCAVYPERPES